MAQELLVTCPVCDSEVTYRRSPKVWFGRCGNCRTRIYTDLIIMDAYLLKQKEATKDASKGQATT